MTYILSLLGLIGFFMVIFNNGFWGFLGIILMTAAIFGAAGAQISRSAKS